MTELMVDTIHADVHHVPVGAVKIAGYTTGTPDIRWTDADFARFPHSGHGRIDQSNTVGLAGGANIKDVEGGAATIADAVETAKAGHEFTTYLAKSNLGAARAAMRAAGIKNMTYHVADWGIGQAAAEALLGGDIVAVQFASPSDGGHLILPGTDLTLAEANCDLSVTVPGYCAVPAPAAPSGIAEIHASFNLATGRWHVRNLPAKVHLGKRNVWASAELQYNVHTGHVRVKPLPFNASPLG